MMDTAGYELGESGGSSRLEFDRALIDAERVMMQIVQTSLSLIGFGFTISEVVSTVTPGRMEPAALASARLLGSALQGLGLLLLGMGLWNQARYRRRLSAAWRAVAAPGKSGALRYRDTPSFTVAVLLLAIGLFTFGTVVLPRLF